MRDDDSRVKTLASHVKSALERASRVAFQRHNFVTGAQAETPHDDAYFGLYCQNTATGNEVTAINGSSTAWQRQSAEPPDDNLLAFDLSWKVERRKFELTELRYQTFECRCAHAAALWAFATARTMTMPIADLMMSPIFLMTMDAGQKQRYSMWRMTA